MREAWQRGTPVVTLRAEAAAELLGPLMLEARVLSLEPTSGGLSNSNIRVRLSGDAPDLLLRFYQRDPAQAAKEAALARLVEGRVPAPRFLHLGADNPVTGGPFAVLEWIEGETLAAVAPRLDAGGLQGLALDLGRTLAAIHGFEFPRHGFFGPDLALPEAIDLGRDGQLAFLRQCLLEGPGGARLGPEFTQAVLDLVAREGDCLDTWLEPPCLTHADFNPSNILVRKSGPETGWSVAAVLDWEFALAGTPAFDFGNLLRPPLGQRPGFAEALAEGYAGAGGRLPPDWRRVARLADLTAWADFLARPESGSALLAEARRSIAATLAAFGRASGASPQ